MGRKGLGSTLLRMAVVSGLMAGLTLLVVPVAEAQSTSPYTTLNIGVGSDPHGVAADATTGTVYVTNGDTGSAGNSVTVIAGATNTVSDTVTVVGESGHRRLRPYRLWLQVNNGGRP